MTAVPRADRLLMLALDAGDPSLIRRWAAEGHLPTFARLLRGGAVRPIDTPAGVLEGAVWPTLISGVSPATHAMISYLQLRPGTYDLTWGIRADRLAVPTFYERLSRAGKRVVVVDVPFDRPVPGLNGLQLVNWGAHDGLWSWARSSWPAELVDDVARRFGNHPVPTCDREGRTRADYLELREALLRGVAKKVEVLQHLMAEGAPWDLFFGVFSESHCAGHQCWHFLDPGHPRHDGAAPAALVDIVRDVYAAIDAGLGRLLEAAPPGAHTLVLLSHGMGPYYAGSHLIDDVLERLGVNPEHPGNARLPSREEAVAGVGRGAWAARRLVPPELRARAKAGAPGRLARALWHWTHPEVNPWPRMRAFAVPTNNMTGAIRINLAGRENDGTVQPGTEYHALCSELSEAFLALDNADTGRPAVRWVRRADELYDGPRLAELPDLFIEWEHDRPIATLRSPRIGTVSRPHRGSRTGDHLAGGLVIGHGPRLAGLAAGGLRTLDVAPTILDFFGLDRIGECEGTSALRR